MDRILLLTTSLILALSPLGNAAQIVIGNLNGLHPLTTPAGDLVPIDRGFVQVGSISLTDEEVMASPSDREGLIAGFEEFGSPLRFGAGGSGGFYSGLTNASIDVGDPLVNQPIYIVAGDGDDLATSDAIWIFKSNERFESDTTEEFSASIDLDAELSFGAVLVGMPVNTFVPLAGDSFDGSEMVAFIPEPRVGILCLLAGIILIASRRFARS